MHDHCSCTIASCLNLVKLCLCRLNSQGSQQQQQQQKQPRAQLAAVSVAWPVQDVQEQQPNPVKIEEVATADPSDMENGGERSHASCCLCSDNNGGLCSNRLSSEVIWENCWSQQTAQLRDQPIYRLLDLHGGGKLVDAYETGGIALVCQVIRQEVPAFLYHGGQGAEFSGSEIIARQLQPQSEFQTAVSTADELPQVNGSSSFSRRRSIIPVASSTVTPPAPSPRPLSVLSLSRTIEKPSASPEHALKPPRPTVQPPAAPVSASRRQPISPRLFDPARPVYNEATRHFACWDLAKRGIFGESLLHLCFVCGSPVHRQLAKALLSVFPSLARDMFVGWEYFGQSSLHMAIMNKDLDMVKLLVECGADIEQRAVGDFFLPEDQRRVRKAKRTDYKGHIYLGEYPLAFAGCFGSSEIYDFLINCGANPDSTDQFGNSVLHMLVIHNRTEIYRLAVKHHKRPANPKLLNKAGLNPISLAAKLGRKSVFNEIIDLSASEMWRFADITCKVYPLTGLDTIGHSGRTDWNSAFMYIINGKTDEHLDMIEEGVINQLLLEKWQKYARARFIQRLCILAAHIIIMSAAIYMRPLEVPATSGGGDSNSTLAANSSTTDAATTNVTTIAIGSYVMPTQELLRYIFETITVANSLLTLVMHIDEVREQGILDFLRGLGDAPPKAAFLIACLLISMALPMRILSLFMAERKDQLLQAEESLLLFAVPCVWIYLLFFAGGTKLNGTFVTMIYKMLIGDMARFGIIYAIILICFAQTYDFLFRDIDPRITSVLSFKDPPSTIMTLFQMTLGDFKYDEFGYTDYTPLAKFVFAVFLILVPIMLLNMLIAMMGNTYNMVNRRSQKEWTSMWAKIVVILERSYSPKQLLKFQSEYAIPVPGKDDEVGLMTILRTKKTLALLRRTATNNWKRTCRKILRLIQDHKAAGNPHSFSFDGSVESQVTLRQQRARLIGLQKSVVRTQRYARVLKRMERTAMGATVAAIQDDLDHSIEEIFEAVPLLKPSPEGVGETEFTEPPPNLSNSAFHILAAARDSPKTASLKTLTNATTISRRAVLASHQHSSLEDDNSLQESVGSTTSAETRNQTERSDSASSSRNLIVTSGSSGSGFKLSPPDAKPRIGTATKAAQSVKKTLGLAKASRKK